MDEEVRALRERLKKASEAYYVNDEPIMSDTEYDILLRRLRELEGEHPELDAPDSPTHVIGGAAAFSPVQHPVPLQSLNDVFSPEELGQFDERMRTYLLRAGVESPLAYTVTPKIDGLSVAVTYQDGAFVQGATRGNGQTGEDVTHNLLTIKDLPRSIHAPGRVIIRGEVYMRKDVFEELNAKNESEGRLLMANPRNAAAGSLRQLDPAVAARRRLSLFVYNIQSWDSGSPESHEEILELLRQWGMPAVDYTLANSIDGALKAIEAIGEKRREFPYETDGAVVMISSLSQRALIGETSRAPRWAAAYKFPPDCKSTVLNNISIQVGRTGALTPKAELEPVRLAGTVVRNATLHNQDFISAMDIRIGDTVQVRKAGEIIPEIVAVEYDKRPDGAQPYVFPGKCPECGAAVERTDGEAAVRCPNLGCPAQRLRLLIHFCSRGAMDIEGLGSSTCAVLLDKNLVETPADLYTLDWNALSDTEGFGEKSLQNLRDAVEKSKTQDLSSLLFALGIKHVGQKAARLLSGRFGSMDAVIAASEEEMTLVPEIGGAIAGSVRAYFSSPSVIDMIDKLRAAGVNMNGKMKEAGLPFEGKVFVLTGMLESFTRDEAAARIEALGGKVSGSVSGKTSFLIAGANAGSKLAKASVAGVEVLSEDEFLALLDAQSEGAAG